MSDPISAENIKLTRERLGESQEVFGRRFGVDQSTVHRWETEGVSTRGATRIAVGHILATLDQPARVAS